MLKINKKAEPDFFKDFKKRYKLKNWEEYNKKDLDGKGIEVKRKLKIFMLEEEQKGYCPYCERKILKYKKSDVEKNELEKFLKEQVHIEHIIPKSLKPQLFEKYDNILSCCTSRETCGFKKGNEYSENFINPVLEDPKEYFEYDIKTGEIRPKNIEQEKRIKAEVTIEILNLNQERLKNQRYTLLKLLMQIHKMEDFSYYKNENFPSLVEYFENNFSPLKQM